MNIKFRDELLRLQFGRYQNTNMISLQLYTTGDYPEPYMTASFNPDLDGLIKDTGVTEDDMPVMAVKNWSENEGIEQALIDNNVINTLAGTVQAGYCEGNIYTVNKKFLGDE